MAGFGSGVLVKGAVLVLLLGCTGASPGADEPAAAAKGHEGVKLEAGEIVTLRGVVTENVRACEVDGPCFLELRVESGDCTVLYAEPRGVPCPNAAAFEAGFALATGDEIEVRARVTGGSRLTTCDSEELFIKRLTRTTVGEGAS